MTVARTSNMAPEHQRSSSFTQQLPDGSPHRHRPRRFPPPLKMRVERREVSPCDLSTLRPSTKGTEPFFLCQTHVVVVVVISRFIVVSLLFRRFFFFVVVVPGLGLAVL